ncbi:hypothetical protein TNCV_1159021 [Trichonephila clavipes]|nr:hypothetical protein TNCV_1159021 [Trichonephila clavipes]
MASYRPEKSTTKVRVVFNVSSPTDNGIYDFSRPKHWVCPQTQLELCASVLFSKLVKRVIDALKLESVKVYLRTDSMIVLSWLQKELMDLKTFVQNRIAKIQDLFPVRQ